MVDNASKTATVSISGVSLLKNYLINAAHLQRLLFLLSFLTYGVGDGVTAAYMIEKAGVMAEANPFVQFVYYSFGVQGVILFKILFGFIILLPVWIVSRQANTYWTVNGFLAALCVGGIMAIKTNLMVTDVVTPPSPELVIIAFLILTVLFVIIGDMMDKH